MISKLIQWIKDRAVSIVGVNIISVRDLLEHLEFIKEHEVQ
jgi:hypothetical protein